MHTRTRIAHRQTAVNRTRIFLLPVAWSVSRRNYGRKVVLHRPRLSDIIEFTRRRHVCIWDNDTLTVGGAEAESCGAPQRRSTNGLGSCVGAVPEGY